MYLFLILVEQLLVRGVSTKILVAMCVSECWCQNCQNIGEFAQKFLALLHDTASTNTALLSAANEHQMVLKQVV
jgi:hypothetical protein